MGVYNVLRGVCSLRRKLFWGSKDIVLLPPKKILDLKNIFNVYHSNLDENDLI